MPIRISSPSPEDNDDRQERLEQIVNDPDPSSDSDLRRRPNNDPNGFLYHLAILIGSMFSVVFVLGNIFIVSPLRAILVVTSKIPSMVISEHEQFCLDLDSNPDNEEALQFRALVNGDDQGENNRDTHTATTSNDNSRGLQPSNFTLINSLLQRNQAEEASRVRRLTNRASSDTRSVTGNSEYSAQPLYRTEQRGVPASLQAFASAIMAERSRHQSTHQSIDVGYNLNPIAARAQNREPAEFEDSTSTRAGIDRNTVEPPAVQAQPTATTQPPTLIDRHHRPSQLSTSIPHTTAPYYPHHMPSMVPPSQTIASATADAQGNFPPRVYTQAAWDSRMAGFPVSRTEMNSLVMNYLIVEGYQEAALRFAREANISLASPQGNISGNVDNSDNVSSNLEASTSSLTETLMGEGMNRSMSEAMMEYSNIPTTHSTTRAPISSDSDINTSASSSFNTANLDASSHSPTEADNLAAESMYSLLGAAYGLNAEASQSAKGNNSKSAISSQSNNPNTNLYYHQQPPLFSLNHVHERMVIKSLILRGSVQEAIEKINDVDPQLLDSNSPLHFSLLRLQLIELIREANNKRLSRHRERYGPNSGFSDQAISDIEMIQPALDFAASHLARRAPTNPKFLEHLEQTMALLCFPPDQLVPQLEELMDLKMRQKVAQDVNTMLLARQGIAGESNIQALIRLWGWAERELKENEKVEFPLLNPADLIS